MLRKECIPYGPPSQTHLVRLSPFSIIHHLKLPSPKQQTMPIQLLMREDGVEYDLENIDGCALSYATVKELLQQLRKASNSLNSTANKAAVLYHKFKKPPDRYSADFEKLLTIRYRGEAHPLRDFLLQLSLPLLLKVSHDHTINCLESTQEHLKTFADYAEKEVVFNHRFVERAKSVLPEDCKDRFVRDCALYQREITCYPDIFIADSSPSQTSKPNHFRLAAIFEEFATSGNSSLYKHRNRRRTWHWPSDGESTLRRSIVADCS